MRKEYLPIAATLCLAVASPIAAQQQIRFEHVTIDDGLSSQHATRILQDRRGFLWFGTYSGLNRYDGYEFVVYKNDPDDPNSLSHDRITSLYEDHSGLLWIGGYVGLNTFDPTTDVFARYNHDPDDPNSIGKGAVSDVTEDSQGYIWIASDEGGLTRFDKRIGKFTRYVHDPTNPNSLSSDQAWRVLADRNAALWIGTSVGLDRMDILTETFTRYRLDPSASIGSRVDGVVALCEDQSGLLWIGSRNRGLYRLDPPTGSIVHYRHDPGDGRSLNSEHISSLYEDRAGTIWIGTNGGGLTRFDPTSGTFHTYRHDADEPNSLSSNTVSRTFEDRSGVLWVATAEGIDRVNRGAGTAFQFVPLQDSDSGTRVRGANPLRVGAFHEDSAGGMWIGTWQETRNVEGSARWGGGLRYLDRASGSVKRFLHEPGRATGLGSNQVWALHEDKLGTLWIGTDAGGLNRFDPVSGSFTQFRNDPLNPNSISSDEVYAIHDDGSGSLWVGTGDGLNRLDLRTQSWSRYPFDPAPLMFDNYVMQIYEDRVGDLWIGGHEFGLARLNRITGVFEYHRYEPENNNSLSHDAIWAIHEDDAGGLWIGTEGGLNRFESSTGRFTRWTEQNSGLPSNQVAAILGDDAGNLWIKTEVGIARFDVRTNAFRSYDVYVKDLAGAYAAYKSRSGALYFGAKGGYVTFIPDQVTDNSHPPIVVLTDFRLFNESVKPGRDAPIRAHISDVDQITLSHFENDLTFEYAGLHFANPKRNQYAYMLDGYEDEWRYVGTQRTAVYPRLPPGEYVFRAKAANSDGVWNEDGASVRILILSPWWQSSWFRLLAMGAFVALAYLGYWTRVRNLRIRSHMLEAQVAERTTVVNEQNALLKEQSLRMMELDRVKSRFFANISHEFRTPLTLILGPAENALAGAYGSLPDRLRDHLERTRHHAGRLLHLVNQLLDLSRVESGKVKLDLRPHDLIGLLQVVVRSFVPLAERRRILLRFQPKEDSMLARFDRIELEKVFVNVLSNALKFTPEGGKVWVVVCKTEHGEDGARNHVDVVIKDTGPGIAPDDLERIFDRFEQVDGSTTRVHEGTGIGLAVAKELTELHGGKILVESEEGFGAAFTIRLPLEGISEDAVHAMVEGEADLPTPWWNASLDHGIAWAAGADGSAPLVSPKPASRTTLLIVEDNGDVRALLRSYLEEEYVLIEAPDGEAGLEAAREHMPELILSDVMMPKMDGYSLCRAVKNDDALRHIPIILLTAKAAESDAVTGFDWGADDFVVKPFGIEELRARVSRLIAARRSLRAQFSREVVVRPSDVIIQAAEEAFLMRVIEVIEAHLDESHFSVDSLASEVSLGRRQLERKVHALTRQTPGELVRRLRLERAAQLLQAQAGTVAEIANAVGFRSTAYFSTSFRKHFGVSPTEHAKLTT